MFEMTCERALSRHTQGSMLAEKQAVQLSIADSWMKLEQFRLLVMYTAWLIDQSSTAKVRHYISACKVVAADVLADIATKAAHIHGKSLCASFVALCCCPAIPITRKSTIAMEPTNMNMPK